MIIALWVILVLLLVWISLSELPAGWDGHAPLPYLIALSPFAWIGITAVAIWSGCLREWPLMACAIVGLIASLLRKTAYYMNDLKTPNTGELIARKLAEKRESENLTISSNSAAVENLANGHFNVFTLNCRYGEANAHEIVNTVRTNDIAVLALQEMSPDLVTELHDAGLDDLLPFHQFGDPSSSDNGGFRPSRRPLACRFPPPTSPRSHCRSRRRSTSRSRAPTRNRRNAAARIGPPASSGLARWRNLRTRTGTGTQTTRATIAKLPCSWAISTRASCTRASASCSRAASTTPPWSRRAGNTRPTRAGSNGRAL